MFINDKLVVFVQKCTGCYITIQISDHKILIEVKPITLRSFHTTKSYKSLQIHQKSCKPFLPLMKDIKQLQVRENGQNIGNSKKITMMVIIKKSCGLLYTPFEPQRFNTGPMWGSQPIYLFIYEFKSQDNVHGSRILKSDSFMSLVNFHGSRVL